MKSESVQRAMSGGGGIVCGSWESGRGCVSPGPERVKAKAERRMRSQVFFPFCLPQPLGRSHASVSQQGPRSREREGVREWENFSCTEKFWSTCAARFWPILDSRKEKSFQESKTPTCARNEFFTLLEFRGQLDEGYFGFL